MISNLIAFFISHRLQQEPIYEALAQQDGVHLPSVQSRSAPARIQVRQAMRAAPDVLTPDEDVATALGQVTGGLFEAWPVSGEEGLWGMVRNVDLEEAVRSGPPERTLAEMLGGTFPGGPPDPENLPHVHPDHNLSIALERMGSTGLHALPVVSRANVRVLMGIVLLEDVLGTYGVRKPAGAPVTSSSDTPVPVNPAPE